MLDLDPLVSVLASQHDWIRCAHWIVCILCVRVVAVGQDLVGCVLVVADHLPAADEDLANVELDPFDVDLAVLSLDMSSMVSSTM